MPDPPGVFVPKSPSPSLLKLFKNFIVTAIVPVFIRLIKMNGFNSNLNHLIKQVAYIQSLVFNLLNVKVKFYLLHYLIIKLKHFSPIFRRLLE